MDRRQREEMDRHITGNYGEDQFKGEGDFCVYDDCDGDPVYCRGHFEAEMRRADEAERINRQLLAALRGLVAEIESVNVPAPGLQLARDAIKAAG